jgi:hypothetical protein
LPASNGWYVDKESAILGSNLVRIHRTSLFRHLNVFIVLIADFSHVLFNGVWMNEHDFLLSAVSSSDGIVSVSAGWCLKILAVAENGMAVLDKAFC